MFHKFHVARQIKLDHLLVGKFDWKSLHELETLFVIDVGIQKMTS